MQASIVSLFIIMFSLFVYRIKRTSRDKKIRHNDNTQVLYMVSSMWNIIARRGYDIINSSLNNKNT